LLLGLKCPRYQAYTFRFTSIAISQGSQIRLHAAMYASRESERIFIKSLQAKTP